MEGDGRAAMRRALTPLLDDPGRSAILLDVDGTLAPIAPTAEEAAVPDSTRRLLEALAGAYGLVACVSGRRALDARRLVGVESITYIGNHGLERLRPGGQEPDLTADVADHAQGIAEYARSHMTAGMTELGVRLEDKGPIWSFHWRGAPDEDKAHRALETVATDAEHAGLVPHWGRKVLELRPPLAFDKGVAVGRLLRDTPLIQAALYAGDDWTDLDAFRALRELATLENALCVGVRSEEAPGPLAAEADLLVDGPDGVADLLELLATAPAPR